VSDAHGSMLAAAFVAALILVPPSVTAQRPPDFSGEWVLVSATASGGGRGGTDRPDAHRENQISSNTVSGAAFNCGRQCTIVQKGQTLTIDGASLASRDKRAPAVTLQMDGHQASVVDSFSPGRQILAAAQWVGDKLKITSPTSYLTTTQFVSLEATQLVVVTSADIEGDQPVTFRYNKK
jgi:hypothetical protein